MNSNNRPASSGRRDGKDVDVKGSQDLLGHASQEHLGDPRAAVRPDDQDIGLHLLHGLGDHLERGALLHTRTDRP